MFETSTTTSTRTYDMKDEPIVEEQQQRSSSRHRRKMSGGDHDPTDGSGSLTYSAASSVNSAAGESTDSSFADIMKVLDGQETKELAALLKSSNASAAGSSHGGHSSHHYHRHHGGGSVSDSLAYSTDADSNMMRSTKSDGLSHLMGADLVSTTTGQNSDQNADGGNYSPLDSITGNASTPTGNATSSPTSSAAPQNGDVLFAPAEASESLKQRKDRKRRERRDRRERKLQQFNNIQSSSSSTTNNKVEKSSLQVNTTNTSGKSKTQMESRQGTPPDSRPPKSTSPIKQTTDIDDAIDDICNTKWWMFCFPDASQTTTEPQR